MGALVESIGTVIVVLVALAAILVVNRSYFLAHAVAPVFVLHRGDGRGSRCLALSDKVNPANDNPAGVTEMTHVRGATHIFHKQHEGNQPDGLDGHGGEDQHEGSIGPGKRIGEDNAHDGAGCAQRRDEHALINRPEAHQNRHPGYRGDQETGPDAANEVIAEESLISPELGQRGPEHPEHQKVEDDVKRAEGTVEPHVSEGLPKFEVDPDLHG